jgi:hypothetical protein
VTVLQDRQIRHGHADLRRQLDQRHAAIREKLIQVHLYAVLHRFGHQMTVSSSVRIATPWAIS